MHKVTLFDTTLRDGEQAEGISFTVKDKIKITQLLDKLGIHYIEGGWPGSNPKAQEYFQKVQEIKLANAKIVAFGSTRRAKNKVEDDLNIKALIESGAPVIVIFGKTWDFHVQHALNISQEENLNLIYDSIKFLKNKQKEVIYDAEHFFDGYKSNKEYALSTLKTAKDAGADILCLCDTNGGTLPSEVTQIIKEVKNTIGKIELGIHPHNDSGLAVANALVAVDEGVTHIQGTLNGYGERCGNLNLSTLIPNLILKKKVQCISENQLKELTSISLHMDEIANIAHNHFAPYVGRSAFTHKGGVHVSAVLKNSQTYEHINPELVGNKRRVVVSELAGISNLIYKAKELGLEINDQKSPAVRDVINKIKQLEHFGYQFEEADASFEILVRKHLKQFHPIINLERFRVISEISGQEFVNIEATIKTNIKGHKIHIVSEGNGPVSALDHALRKALLPIFSQIEDIKLTDYKVRVLNSKQGTNSVVRVLVQWKNKDMEWGTVGVSENIIEASWLALVDSYEYILAREKNDNN